MYETTHGREPGPCKFKNQPKEIPKLLERIVLDDQTVAETKAESNEQSNMTHFENLCQASRNPKVFRDQAVQTEWSETQTSGFLKTLRNFFNRK